MNETVLLDPTAEKAVPELEVLPKSSSLKNKSIALLDISKPRGDVFLDRMEEILMTHGARVNRYSKPTFTRPAPTELLQRISLECDLVVEALAD